MESQSLRKRLWEDLNDHLWIHGERDVQWLQALEEWVNKYYIHFIRVRWVEHVSGIIKWDMLDEEKYNILNQHYTEEQSQSIKRRLVTDLMKDLELAHLAFEYQEKPWVIRLLTMCDINEWRLSFWCVSGLDQNRFQIRLSDRLNMYNRAV